MSIQAVFDTYAAEYDGARRKLIPCFDDFYQSTVSVILRGKEENIRVLDLGAGTGLLSEMVALSYPNSAITLVDISGKMLAISKTRLGKLKNKIQYREENYAKSCIQGTFDVIISSLSIHHLDELEKSALFAKCFQALALGGVFINADQVYGETPAIEKIYREKWLEQVKDNGVTKEELDSAFERMKEDKMSTLTYQLSCLCAAGFVETTCWYKNFSFAVYSGKKICNS